MTNIVVDELISPSPPSQHGVRGDADGRKDQECGQDGNTWHVPPFVFCRARPLYVGICYKIQCQILKVMWCEVEK